MCLCVVAEDADKVRKLLPGFTGSDLVILLCTVVLVVLEQGLKVPTPQGCRCWIQLPLVLLMSPVQCNVICNGSNSSGAQSR